MRPLEGLRILSVEVYGAGPYGTGLLAQLGAEAIMALGLVSAVMKARTTGKGCDVDVALYDTALHQLSYPAVWHLNEGFETTRLPRSSHPSVVPSQLFQPADGWLFVMCQTPKFWLALCSELDRQEWTYET